jgi:hypothetical protein
MMRVEAIVKGYGLMVAAPNMVQWRRDNPGIVAALDEARRLAQEEGLICAE